MRQFLKHPLQDLRHPVQALRRPAMRRAVMWILAIGTFGYLFVGLKHESQERSQQIQNERKASARRSCQETNARNRQLTADLVQITPSSRRRAANFDRNLRIFVNALAPLRNCDLYVDEVVPS